MLLRLLAVDIAAAAALVAAASLTRVLCAVQQMRIAELHNEMDAFDAKILAQQKQ